MLLAEPTGLQEFTIRDTRDAGHFLLSLWEGPREECHARAVRACALVLNGTIDPEVARHTFVLAARSAALLKE